MIGGEGLVLSLLEWLGFYRPLDYHYKRIERLRTQCESPIEVAFWNTAYFELSKFGDFAPQIPVGIYRLDFALTDIEAAPILKVAIEIDGHEYHKSQEQREHDSAKDRYLMRNRWQVVRFTGSQVFNDAQGCVRETVELVNEYIHWLGY